MYFGKVYESLKSANDVTSQRLVFFFLQLTSIQWNISLFTFTLAINECRSYDEVVVSVNF